jgi:hypothetical protein
MRKAKTSKPRRAVVERPVALEADFTRGLFTEIDAALTRWLLAHGETVDHSPWSKTREPKLD